ncbi:hypothetical protein KGF57_003142 [Candida theae]|uniref:JAB1/MPN/MOV34 metalloenzyme domain-containing protein n=1 Tax=Candida theae TaxID=1198502 RepID=A0AAD5BDL6_9ASCO|nr:uncharacterized protein KGF57_003142 [Candida theae]KAI5957448.1 hypothetical protein KGF57_003142 [Candida theae]
MSSVELHSKFLLNLADIQARKIGFDYGILLGFQDNDKFVVATSFEIISANQSIDYEFLIKRYNQLKLVYPAFTILGIYHISTYNNIYSFDSTIAMSQVIQRCFQSYDIHANPQQIYIIYNKDEKGFPFKSFLVDQPLATTIKTNQTEAITVTEFTKTNQTKSIQSHVDELEIVKDKVPSDTSEPPTIAQLLKLQTTQLALLTEQKATLDGAQNRLLRLWQT